MVETDHGLLRRNRRHLQHTGYPNVNEPHSRGEPSTPVESFEVDQPALTPEPGQSPSLEKTATRSGRVVHCPRRFEDCVISLTVAAFSCIMYNCITSSACK